MGAYMKGKDPLIWVESDPLSFFISRANKNFKTKGLEVSGAEGQNH